MPELPRRRERRRSASALEAGAGDKPKPARGGRRWPSILTRGKKRGEETDEELERRLDAALRVDEPRPGAKPRVRRISSPALALPDVGRRMPHLSPDAAAAAALGPTPRDRSPLQPPKSAAVFFATPIFDPGSPASPGDGRSFPPSPDAALLAATTPDAAHLRKVLADRDAPAVLHLA